MKVPGRFVDWRLGLAPSNCPKLRGLDLRVGRACTGICRSFEDLLERCTSTLLIGQPGVGKSTTLREMSRLLSDTYRKTVVVVDTTNELGGFGTLPHQALGMRDVTRLEIRDAKEVEAAKTIANQGVVLLASAYGTSLRELVHNPTLCLLVGEEPAFKAVIEIGASGSLCIHEDVARSVDNILRGRLDDVRTEEPTNLGEHGDEEGSASTGSTSGCSTLEVLRPGVGKVPSRILANLSSGELISVVLTEA